MLLKHYLANAKWFLLVALLGLAPLITSAPDAIYRRGNSLSRFSRLIYDLDSYFTRATPTIRRVGYAYWPLDPYPSSIIPVHLRYTYLAQFPYTPVAARNRPVAPPPYSPAAATDRPIPPPPYSPWAGRNRAILPPPYSPPAGRNHPNARPLHAPQAARNRPIARPSHTYPQTLQAKRFRLVTINDRGLPGPHEPTLTAAVLSAQAIPTRLSARENDGISKRNDRPESAPETLTRRGFGEALMDCLGSLNPWRKNKNRDPNDDPESGTHGSGPYDLPL